MPCQQIAQSRHSVHCNLCLGNPLATRLKLSLTLSKRLALNLRCPCLLLGGEFAGMLCGTGGRANGLE